MCIYVACEAMVIGTEVGVAKPSPNSSIVCYIRYSPKCPWKSHRSIFLPPTYGLNTWVD